ncbi:hypothetical protein HGRIS_004817 [Hohenbuehelia grisea]|uniref:Uncharacterized protein n=1 Tax=Hohenbuehelia grisea TaxID=104357 RepID=A0ABR3JD45_9AGAR
MAECQAFRELQQRTGVLISGSTALAFVDRALPYTASSDLDLYVEQRYAHTVGMWLLSQGYTFFRSNTQPRGFEEAIESLGTQDTTKTELMEVDHLEMYRMRGVSGVFDFKNTYAGEERKVQLIVSKRCPMEIILNFHSTVVMNVIGFDFAYCLFPKATLEHRIAIVHSTSGPHQRDARAKYVERGWRMVLSTKELIPVEKSCFVNGRRFLGDAQCWSIPLTEAARLRPNFDRLRLNGALIAYNRLGRWMAFEVATSPVLNHNFTIDIAPRSWSTLEQWFKQAAEILDNDGRRAGVFDAALGRLAESLHKLPA